MIFHETRLPGAYLIDLEKREDERGFFARGWCRKEFETRGLNPDLVQANIGYSKKKGTLRGMHFQTAPGAEVKVVRCTRGAVHDVIVDLRPRSPTFKQWVAAELTADNHRLLYVPEGFAHGYLTLEDSAELFYHTTQFYSPECAKGVRYDDPAFNIAWPLKVEVISEADRKWPDFKQP